MKCGSFQVLTCFFSGEMIEFAVAAAERELAKGGVNPPDSIELTA